MPDEFLHLHKKEVKRDFTVLLLLLPLIVFVLCLAVVFANLNKNSMTAYFSDSQTAILGESDEKH